MSLARSGGAVNEIVAGRQADPVAAEIDHTGRRPFLERGVAKSGERPAVHVALQHPVHAQQLSGQFRPQRAGGAAQFRASRREVGQCGGDRRMSTLIETLAAPPERSDDRASTMRGWWLAMEWMIIAAAISVQCGVDLAGHRRMSMARKAGHRLFQAATPFGKRVAPAR